MIVDLNNVESIEPIRTGLCIVGAGPAGIALAKKVNELNSQIDICLLESGGFELEADTQQLYSGYSVGQPYFPLQSTRLRYFGGSTGHWQGWCAPMNGLDFENRPWMTDSGWPISLAELQPHYKWSNHFFDLGSPQYHPDIWMPLLEEFPSFSKSTLVARAWQFSSPPINVGDHYRSSIAQSSRINLHIHANAINVDVSAEGDSIESISVSNLARTRQKKVIADNYVLASGGIENPRLLLSSNNVLSGGIGNGNGVVGRYFHDHINVACGELYSEKLARLEQYQRFKFDGRSDMGVGYCPTITEQKKHKIGNLAAYLTFGAGSRRSRARRSLAKIKHNLGKGKLPSDFPSELYAIVADFDSVAALAAIRLRHWIDPGQPAIVNHGTLSVLSEQQPNYDSRIYLSDEKDALGVRRPVVDWRLLPIDHRTIRESMLNLASEFARLNLGRIKLDQWLVSESPEWPEGIVAGHHPMGTTRMSDDVNKGVVDSECKVHGIANLYIAGSSVFPTGGYANPTLSVVALASRLGEYLVKRRASG